MIDSTTINPPYVYAPSCAECGTTDNVAECWPLGCSLCSACRGDDDIVAARAEVQLRRIAAEHKRREAFTRQWWVSVADEESLDAHRAQW